jgi:hypothetical protein
MKYRVAYRSPLSGEVHHFRKVYTDLIGVQSAVDDYKIGEPETEFWYEPIEEQKGESYALEIPLHLGR